MAPTAAPTLFVWIAMNISSRLEKEKGFMYFYQKKKKKVAEMKKNMLGDRMTEW